MSKRMTVNIKMDDYLIRFLYSVYQPDKLDEPLFLPGRHRLNKNLSLLLSRPPETPTLCGGPSYLELVIPYFENVNINSVNYISQKSQRTFSRLVRNIFTVQYFEFIDDCLINSIERIDAVNLFIEKYNQPDDLKFQDRLLKMIYRSKKIMKKSPTRTYKKKPA